MHFYYCVYYYCFVCLSITKDFEITYESIFCGDCFNSFAGNSITWLTSGRHQLTFSIQAVFIMVLGMNGIL